MEGNSAVWLLLERINKLTERIKQLEQQVYNTYNYSQYQPYIPSRREEIYWPGIPSNITIDDLHSVANNLTAAGTGSYRVMSQEQYDAEWRPDDTITFVTGDYRDLNQPPVIDTFLDGTRLSNG